MTILTISLIATLGEFTLGRVKETGRVKLLAAMFSRQYKYEKSGRVVLK